MTDKLKDDFFKWFTSYQDKYGGMDWEKADKKLDEIFQQTKQNRDKEWREKIEGMKTDEKSYAKDKLHYKLHQDTLSLDDYRAVHGVVTGYNQALNDLINSMGGE